MHNIIKFIFLLFFFNCFKNLLAFEIVNIRYGDNQNLKRIVIDVNQNIESKYDYKDKNLKITFNYKIENKFKTIKTNSQINKIKYEKDTNIFLINFNNDVLIEKFFFINKTLNKNARLVIDYSLKTKKQKKKIIVIDPGHGGKDSGAVGIKRIFEKNVTLVVAKKLKEKLKSNHKYDVFLTRSDDTYLKLKDRVKYARKMKADLFISLHADYNFNRKVSGVSIYTLSEKASDKEAAALARRENKFDLIEGLDLTTESKEVTNILIDLAQRETMNQSSYLVNYLIKEFSKRTKLLQRTHRFAGFAVLKAPDIPSILIEMGYLSNKNDANLLVSNKYHEKIINSIFYGINNYFDWKNKNKE